MRDKDSPGGKAGSPYYIGVAGYEGRPFQSHRRTPVPTDERRIRMLRGNLTHEQARKWESFYIEKYGRKDIKSGRQMLINRTGGGDGAANPSLSTRAKISAANKGRKLSEETIAKLKAVRTGQTRSAEARANIRAGLADPAVRERMSAANKGKPKSAEARAKSSAAQKGKPKSKEAVQNKALASRRNTAKRYGVDPDRYAALPLNERRRVTLRYSQGKRGEEALFKGLS